MSEETPNKKKVTRKKVIKKAAPIKQAIAKPSESEATESVIETAANIKDNTPKTDNDILPTVQSIVAEMSKDREIRDKQISSLIEEVREGFGILSNKTASQGDEHQKEMTGLYQTLQNAFGTIKDSSEQREDRNISIFKSLSEAIMTDHEQTLKEVHEQEVLQDKKIKYFDQVQQERSGRNRLIAIPGVIIAITAIVYMFYVVGIMESAMTSMSHDIHKIQLSVGGMSEKIATISSDTTSMNRNMEQLNGSTHQMSKDLNVMTNNVAPAMNGIRQVMPWAP